MVFQVTSDAFSLSTILFLYRLSALPTIMSRTDEVISLNKFVILRLSELDFTFDMIEVSTSRYTTLSKRVRLDETVFSAV